MASIEQTVSSFVPELIVEHVQEALSHRGEAYENHVHAGVLFADISGFTSLTESLSKGGPDGAERLTRVLNAYFGGIIDHIESAGGDVVKFAGDALLAVWPCDQRKASPGAVVQRMGAVSLRLQTDMHNLEVAPGIVLSMKIAIGIGDLRICHLGGVFDRWEVLISGRPLAQLGEANDLAGPGEIVLAEEAARFIDADGIEAVSGRVYKLTTERTIPPRFKRPTAERQLDEQSVRQLLRFLPAAIRARVEAGYADWLSELRQVSVVFMNLQGFGIDSSLDECQAVMRALQAALYRYEGSINKISVDDKGVSVIGAFGLPPLTHTDDPERAVRAALDMLEASRELGVPASVGVCTGQAFCGVVGNAQRREYTVMGDVVNLSARLMAKAGTGGILCDERTQDAVGERLRFDALAPMPIKGKAHPITAYRPSPASLQTVQDRLSREVFGRQRQREVLGNLLQTRVPESGNVAPRICLTADSGLGKWTLVQQVLEQANTDDWTVLLVRGDPLDQTTPFNAWRAPLARILAFEPNQQHSAAQVESVLACLPETAERDHAPLLNDVLLLGLSESKSTANLTAEQRREALLNLLTEVIRQSGKGRRWILAIRDAHLLDSSSWALLKRLDQFDEELPLVLTMQPGRIDLPPNAVRWLRSPRVQHIELEALEPENLLEVARARLQVTSLSVDFADLLISRSNGNPLYCEELVDTLLSQKVIQVDRDHARLDAQAQERQQLIPPSLQGLLSAKIDRLGARAQLTLKVASVIGSPFAMEVVAWVHPGTPSPRELNADIEELTDAGLVEQVPEGTRPPFGRPPYFQFPRTLIRDVAYGLMLYSQRRELHEAIAIWMEEHLQEEFATHYSSLARHWYSAHGQSEQSSHAARNAVRYYEMAGDRALKTYASVEAIEFYDNALRCLEDLEQGDETASWELKLLIKMGDPLCASYHYSSDRVIALYERAKLLSLRLSKHAELFDALRGLWQTAIRTSEYGQATRLAEELVELARSTGDVARTIEANRALGNSAFWPGNLAQAEKALKATLSMTEQLPIETASATFSLDTEVATRSLLAWTLASQGDCEGAIEQTDIAKTLATRHDNPMSMAYALGATMWTHFIFRDRNATQTSASEAVRFCTEHNIAYIETAAQCLVYWSEERIADPDTGLTIEAIIKRWDKASNGTGVTLFQFTLAEIHARLGNDRQAIDILEQPSFQERLRQERWFLADAERLTAECLWRLRERERAMALLASASRTAAETGCLLAQVRIKHFLHSRLATPQTQLELMQTVARIPRPINVGTVSRVRNLLA